MTPSETRTLPGLDGEVEIITDRWGVPHIYATTRHDAYVAQGFQAARDRLFQIDLWRRRGLGPAELLLGVVEQAVRARRVPGDAVPVRRWLTAPTRTGPDCRDCRADPAPA